MFNPQHFGGDEGFFLPASSILNYSTMAVCDQSAGRFSSISDNASGMESLAEAASHQFQQQQMQMARRPGTNAMSTNKPETMFCDSTTSGNISRHTYLRTEDPAVSRFWGPETGNIFFAKWSKFDLKIIRNRLYRIIFTNNFRSSSTREWLLILFFVQHLTFFQLQDWLQLI